MTSTTIDRKAPPKTGAGSRFIKNVSSNWAGLFVGIVCSFILAPLTVRSLGNVYYGIWTLLMQFTGYLWLFDFGVRESVIKYVAQYHASGDHASLKSTVRTAVSIYAGVAGVAMVAIVVLALALPFLFNIPPDAVLTARITCVLAGATVAQGFVFNVFVGVLGGLQRFYLTARLSIIFTLIRSALVYVLLSAGFGIVTLAVVQFAVTLALNLLIYRYAVRELPYLSLKVSWPERAETVKLLNYGKYVLISNLGDKVIFATDSIIIGVFLPVSALTYYAIGGTLIEQLRGFIASMAGVLNPLSSSLEARRETQSVSTVLLAGARGSMVLGLPICIGFIMLGDRFIGIWMGGTYAEAGGQILRLLAWGHLVGLPYNTISSVLYGLGRHRIVAISRMLEGALNLGLSLALIRSMGLAGVAIGTLVPQCLVVGLVLPLVLPRMLPLRLRDYYAYVYVRPLLASAPFWLWCWFVDAVVRPERLATFVGIVSAGLSLYALPCWFIALRPEERQMLGARIRRLTASPATTPA